MTGWVSSQPHKHLQTTLNAERRILKAFQPNYSRSLIGDG